MSQQAVDLRRSVQLVRRHKILVGSVLLLGIAAGGAYAVVKPAAAHEHRAGRTPATRASSAASGGRIAGGTDPYTATQEVIAGSYQVLLNALPDVRPAMSLDQLRHDIQVGSPAADIVSITAKARTPPTQKQPPTLSPAATLPTSVPREPSRARARRNC